MSNPYYWGSAPQTDLLDWDLTAEDAEHTAIETHPDPEVQAEFETLAKEWIADTGSLSLMAQKVMHPAYQRIIGMGQRVVPVLLRELEVRPNHWFHALRSITGDDPVEPGHRGNLREMAAAWVEWGRLTGYLA
jgi:hypothetical protein